jgi:hypothetical protein
VRVVPGNNLVPKTPLGDVGMADVSVEEPSLLDVDAEPVSSAMGEESLPAAEPVEFTAAEAVSEPPIMDAVTVDEIDEDDDRDEDGRPYVDDVDGNRIDFEPSRPAKSPGRKTTARRPATSRAPAGRAPAGRAAKPRAAAKAPRARKTGGRR